MSSGEQELLNEVVASPEMDDLLQMGSYKYKTEVKNHVNNKISATI